MPELARRGAGNHLKCVTIIRIAYSPWLEKFISGGTSMENRKGHKVFRFESDVAWSQEKECTVCASGKPEIQLSSPPEFKGRAGVWTPEDMFVASVNVCTLMTFLAYAKHKNLGLADYESSVEGVLEYSNGKYRFTEVTIHPHVTVKTREEVELAGRILQDAHDNCLITNSIVAQVKLFPHFRVATTAE
jgi:organic hydroperoxide reductase OsmC/OhrA